MAETMHRSERASYSNEPITLMLLGGGIRFPAFVGALQAVEDKGLPIAKIVGSATGSIVAALYAVGMSPADLYREALAVDTGAFRDISLKSMVTGYGLCSGNRLEAWLEGRLGGKKFADELRWPLQIIATDMRHYRPVVFSREQFPEVKISTAARCSAGIPGTFACRRFVHHGKEYAFVDGSLMAGIIERNIVPHEKTLVIKTVSKRTLSRNGNKLSLKRYFYDLLTFSLHSQEKEFLKGGKWKDTILVFCGEIPPARFTLKSDEKQYLYEQGYEQTIKYLEYKWGV
ncbi:MAG TPA: patatin-like phospholipase family protein [Geobacteraceae bacterium]